MQILVLKSNLLKLKGIEKRLLAVYQRYCVEFHLLLITLLLFIFCFLHLSLWLESLVGQEMDETISLIN